MVPGLAHVILHVGFCNAIARLRPETAVAVQVRLSDRAGRVTLDRTFRVDRGDGSDAIVEFDSARGIFHLDAAAPKYGCSTSDFLMFMPDHTRSVSEQLDSSPASPQAAPVILFGEAPQTMLYANPTFVLFDKTAVACGKPVPAPLAARVNVENDQDAYYAWLYNDEARQPDTTMLALRLQTPTHQHHYVRIPLPFPMPPSRWPSGIQLNVSEDMIADLATQPIDTLLCPKMWRTSAG